MTRKITELVYMDLDKLKKHPNNPRTIKNDSFKKLMTSIDENPDFFEARPIMVSDRTGELIIIGGNQRYAAAKELGFKQAPVIVLPALTEEKEKEIMIRDNIANGEWDYDKLANEWDAGQLNEWGLDVPDWDKEAANAGLTDPDDVPEPEENPVTVQGDLWVLGDHRLLCGDSTKEDNLTLLFNGSRPDLVFSDPPYGIDIVSAKSSTVGGASAVKFGSVDGGKIVNAKKYAQIIGDSSTESAWLFVEACKQSGISDFILWGGNYFTDFLSPSMCWLVWDKQNTGNFADVELAWTSFDKAAKLYSFMWNGMARAGNHKDELKTRVHPTQKPVGLFELVFNDFDFQSCFDGFLGSGSTLIAAEKLNRVCFGMELSESYCDVIIKRWQDFSGKIAVLESTGQTFEEVKAQRHG